MDIPYIEEVFDIPRGLSTPIYVIGFGSRLCRTLLIFISIVAGGHQTEKQPRCAINNAEKRRFTDAKAARVRGLQAR